MRTLYIECNMGEAGDMLMSALYELRSAEQKRRFVAEVNGIGIPGGTVAPCRGTTCGLAVLHRAFNV